MVLTYKDGYFIYCNEMWHQLDGLTGLLSQDSYLNSTSEIYNLSL